LIARKLGVVRKWLVVSPDCLKRCGTPEHPRDLPEYPAIVYNYGGGRNDWHFYREEEESVIAPSTVFRANSSEAVFYAVSASIGIGLLPEFLVREAVEEGKLVRLFADWNIPSLPFYAVHTGPRTLPLRTRTVLDFLIEVSSDVLRETPKS
ncbi:substrate binding domain-containing protein, partial [Acetobacter tropicalis]